MGAGAADAKSGTKIDRTKWRKHMNDSRHVGIVDEMHCQFTGSLDDSPVCQPIFAAAYHLAQNVVKFICREMNLELLRIYPKDSKIRSLKGRSISSLDRLRAD
jgi:hypothetical protein